MFSICYVYDLVSEAGFGRSKSGHHVIWITVVIDSDLWYGFYSEKWMKSFGGAK